MSDRAAAVAPYLRQLPYDQEVQGAARRAAAGTRDAYRWVRGKGARQALEDKKLRGRLQQAVVAMGELWSELGESPPKRKPRWGPRLVVLAVAGAGLFAAANADARQKVLILVGRMQTLRISPTSYRTEDNSDGSPPQR